MLATVVAHVFSSDGSLVGRLVASYSNYGFVVALLLMSPSGELLLCVFLLDPIFTPSLLLFSCRRSTKVGEISEYSAILSRPP